MTIPSNYWQTLADENDKKYFLLTEDQLLDLIINKEYGEFMSVWRGLKVKATSNSIKPIFKILADLDRPENFVYRIHCIEILCRLLNLDGEKREHLENVFCGNPNKFDQKEFKKDLQTLETMLNHNH